MKNEPEGWVHWTSIKIEALVHAFVTIRKHKVNTHSVINQIHKRHKHSFCLPICDKWIILPSYKCHYPCYHHRNTFTRVANESPLHAHESTLRDAYACIRIARGVRICTCTKIMHALLSRILSIVNCDCLQHTRSWISIHTLRVHSCCSQSDFAILEILECIAAGVKKLRDPKIERPSAQRSLC